MKQPDLDFSAPPPHNGTATSAHAAHTMTDAAGTIRARILEHIAKHLNGRTRPEICADLGLSGETVRPRCWELLGNNGHTARVWEPGERRRTESGRFAEVLKVLP